MKLYRRIDTGEYGKFSDKQAFNTEIWKEVIEEDLPEAEQAYQLQVCLSNRANAYKAESDPLYMEWQFDQTPEAEQVWKDMVAEIKARYPKP